MRQRIVSLLPLYIMMCAHNRIGKAEAILQNFVELVMVLQKNFVD